MAHANSDSFVIEFKLKTSYADELYLQECFSAGQKIYNTLVCHCRKQLASLRQNKTYRDLLAKYHSLKGSRNQKTVSQQLSAMTAFFGLTEYSLHSFVKVQQKRYKRYINSLTAQKIASAVWRGVEKVLYGNGKSLHFRKHTEFVSLEGKNNSTGLVFRDGVLKVNGRPIHAARHKRDGSASRRYEEEALTHRVKYCRLVCRPVGSSWHYSEDEYNEAIALAEKHKTIKELFEGFSGEYVPEEMDWGIPVGKEI